MGGRSSSGSADEASRPVLRGQQGHRIRGIGDLSGHCSHRLAIGELTRGCIGSIGIRSTGPTARLRFILVTLTRQLSLGLGISVDVQVDLLARGMSATVSTKSSGAPRFLGMGIPAWVIERRRRVLRNQMSQETKVNKHSDTNTLDSYTLIGTQKNNGALFHF